MTATVHRLQHVVPVPELIAGLAEAFKGRDACHCEGDAKLSRSELQNFLVGQGLLPDTARMAVPARDEYEMRFDRLARLIGRNDAHRFTGLESSRAGGEFQSWRTCPTVEEVCQYHREDVLRLGGIGEKGLRRIEINFAREGFFLVDGDRRLLTEMVKSVGMPSEEPDAMPDVGVAPVDREELRRYVSDAFEEMGRSLIAAGQSLLHMTVRAARGDNIGATITRYVGAQMPLYGTVDRIGRPLAEREKVEKAVAKIEGKSNRRTVVA